ncbi:thioredoxin domain-containing protein [Streptomyces buecherae]|uniref:DsbA family protein n=1 Tax=Streptomyces buecherae TaxID=2763006 RepID=UPI0033F4D5B0
MSHNRKDKRSARERLQEQRAKDEARQKRKRTYIAAGVIVVVLGAVGGIGALIASQSDDDEADARGPVVDPKGATGEKRVAIPAGAANAPATLTVFEDFRCPGCAGFENGFRETITELREAGQLRIEYHLVRLIDGNMGGSGSLRAANAAACAQDAGKFSAYHDLLYQNQPREQDDAFADRGYLIELAGKVSGLDTPAFRACVNKGTHDSWVQKVDKAFEKSGHGATPTVLLNGENVYGDQDDPLTPEKLKKEVAEAAKKKGR